MNLWDLGLGKEFLNLTPKSQSNTGKTDNVGKPSKLKTFALC